MDEILQKYSRGKFRECLQLLNVLPDADDIVDNLILENCKLVCESFIRITENDPDKIYDMQEQLYLFYDKVTSLGEVPQSKFVKLRLVVTFNFIYWILLYNDNEINEYDLEQYLEIVNEGISRVSGKGKLSILYSNPVTMVLDNLSRTCDTLRNGENMFMLSELILTIILYIINLKKNVISDCLKILRKLLSEIKEQARVRAVVDEFLQTEPIKSLPLFKFSLNGMPEVLGVSEKVVDWMQLLESTLLFLREEYTESLKSLQKNIHSSVPSLWTYLVILNGSELERWDLCAGFLSKAESLVVQTNLKARYYIMRGRLECNERNHKEAVRLFEEASKLSPKCPAVCYLLGQEYGRMGLYDFMLNNFQKLVEVVVDEDFEVDLRPNFETILLDWVHPPDEITEMEAYYALAVAYGLNENFKEAAETFEKVLQLPPVESSTKRKRIIQLPNTLTILHEAAVMNLHTGNLVRAEQIAMDAVYQYTPQPSQTQKQSLVFKDAEWLKKLIHQELLETDLEPRDLCSEIIYSEDVIFGLPRNVVGMLILSEVQRIQDVDDYKQTLSSVFSTFSKYLSGRRKESEGGEEVTLVKALAGKTCLKVAAVQMKGRDDSQVEKMFKRALSCNKGDKDALHDFYSFLTRAGRHSEALKLWNTFAKEKTAISVDSLSSFSLRYFLTDKLSKRELDKIQAQIDLTDLKIS